MLVPSQLLFELKMTPVWLISHAFCRLNRLYGYSMKTIMNARIGSPCL